MNAYVTDFRRFIVSLKKILLSTDSTLEGALNRREHQHSTGSVIAAIELIILQ